MSTTTGYNQETQKDVNTDGDIDNDSALDSIRPCASHIRTGRRILHRRTCTRPLACHPTLRRTWGVSLDQKWRRRGRYLRHTKYCYITKQGNARADEVEETNSRILPVHDRWRHEFFPHDDLTSWTNFTVPSEHEVWFLREDDNNYDDNTKYSTLILMQIATNCQDKKPEPGELMTYRNGKFVRVGDSRTADVIPWHYGRDKGS